MCSCWRATKTDVLVVCRWTLILSLLLMFSRDVIKAGPRELARTETAEKIAVQIGKEIHLKYKNDEESSCRQNFLHDARILHD